MSTNWQSSFDSAQAQASEATQHEIARRFAAAYPLYVSSAQGLLHLSRISADVNARAKAQKIAARCLDRAAKLKKVDPSLLARSGCLARSRLDQEVLLAKSERKEWRDTAQPSLNDTQHQAGTSYKRSALLVAPSNLKPEDIQQFGVTDCSVVAGLAACVAHQNHFRSSLGKAAVFPQGPDGEPIPSVDGKYQVVLFLNGCRRTIIIDDALPTTADGDLLCASAAGHLWPSLVEKAYLKAHGGYDFAGSNSCIDLHAVTGWISELVRLHSSSFRSEETWNRLNSAFNRGKCLVTAGTRSDASETDATISKHAYAVTNIRDKGLERSLTLLDPWRRRGWSRGLADALPDADSRAHTLTWEAFCATFGSLSLNWDPGIWAHSTTVHGVLVKDKPVILQLGLGSIEPKGGELFVHLARHIGAKNEIDEYILLKAEDSITEAEYTNASQTFLRLMPASTNLHISLARKGPAEEVAFTLTVYYSSSVSVNEKAGGKPYRQDIAGSWKGRSAGGNVTLGTFLDNPHYRIAFSEPANVLVRLQCAGEVPINVKILRLTDSERAENLMERHIVADSKAYTHAVASCEAKLPVGGYTIVCSTFDSQQESDFTLAFETSAPLSNLALLPPEGAGMFSKYIVGTLKHGPKGSYSSPLESLRTSCALIYAKLQGVLAIASSFRLQWLAADSPLQLLLFRSDEQLVAESPRSISASGAKLEVAKLAARSEGYIVECITERGLAGHFQLLVYGDQAFGLRAMT